MIVGTILLTKSNKYVDDLGNLPKRPSHDKLLLAGLIAGKNTTSDGYDMLPPSLQKLVTSRENLPYVPITIRELNKAELLIVSRSSEDFEGGKTFRFDNFKLLVKDRKVEIWILI